MRMCKEYWKVSEGLKKNEGPLRVGVGITGQRTGLIPINKNQDHHRNHEVDLGF